jgi:Mrp family chromosome partitioning ATPase
MIETTSPLSAIFDGLAARAHAGNAQARSFAITSTLHGEGSTTVALGMALSLAGYDQSAVLLVDANWLRPALSEEARRPEAAGLAEYLRGELTLSAAVFEAARPGLWLLPAGQLGTGLPPLGRLSTFLDEAAKRFGKIVVDLPPVLVAPGLVVPWTGVVDQSYLVMRHAVTPVHLIRRALVELGTDRAPQLVLNRTRGVSNGWSAHNHT